MENKCKNLSDREKKVLSLVSHGKKKAITVKEIISIIGGTDEEIRSIVRRLIEIHGCLIGSSNSVGSRGYYFPETLVEKEEAIGKMENRAAEIYKRAHIMRSLPLVTKNRPA
ncbi:hypothetical protein COK30_22930 [Bacillus cereus]|uniref:hypothetical protein n=1 Tax=Bacillus cereus TaxID=1396 RepID=UPI000BF766F9|nr:hypothetical protein [Bacillus cereus]PFR08639.1 hypothetical protein COK30_22930 [Bacillus cereus]